MGRVKTIRWIKGKYVRWFLGETNRRHSYIKWFEGGNIVLLCTDDHTAHARNTGDTATYVRNTGDTAAHARNTGDTTACLRRTDLHENETTREASHQRLLFCKRIYNC